MGYIPESKVRKGASKRSNQTYQVGETVLGLATAASRGGLALVRDWDTNDGGDLVTFETDLTSQLIDTEELKSSGVDG